MPEQDDFDNVSDEDSLDESSEDEGITSLTITRENDPVYTMLNN